MFSTSIALESRLNSETTLCRRTFGGLTWLNESRNEFFIRNMAAARRCDQEGRIALGALDNAALTCIDSATALLLTTGGYNISGPEVESVLLQHEAVAECGVIGVPDETRGQIVRAFVVVNPGYAADDELIAQLQDFVKNNVAPYKYPRVITFVGALPRTETGKLKRFELRTMA